MHLSNVPSSQSPSHTRSMMSGSPSMKRMEPTVATVGAAVGDGMIVVVAVVAATVGTFVLEVVAAAVGAVVAATAVGAVVAAGMTTVGDEVVTAVGATVAAVAAVGAAVAAVAAVGALVRATATTVGPRVGVIAGASVTLTMGAAVGKGLQYISPTPLTSKLKQFDAVAETHS